MRELLLLPIVVGFCMGGLLEPRLGIIGYVWFSLMRPDLLSYAQNRPYSFVLAGATLAGSLRCLPQIVTIFRSPIVLGVLALQVCIAASVFMAVVPAYSWDPWILYLRMLAVVGLIPLLIQTKAWISALVQVMAFSVGFLALKYGLFFVITGGARIGQGMEGGFLGDNNTLALVFVLAVPLCWYARQMTPFKILQWMFTAMAIFGVAAVVSSYSRGAAVALGAVFLWVAMRSKHKIAVGILFLVISIGAVAMVSETYLDRLATIKAPTEEASASNRMEYAFAAIRMWKDYPVFGVGFGMVNQTWLLRYYMANSDVYNKGTGAPGQVIHNTYLQMLADSGAPAFLIYVALVLGTIRYLGKSASWHRKRKTGMDVYPTALEAAMVGFAVGSFFLSRVHFDLIYIMLMAAASWQIYQKDEFAKNPDLVWKPVDFSTPAPWPAQRPASQLPGMTPAPVNRISHQA